MQRAGSDRARTVVSHLLEWFLLVLNPEMPLDCEDKSHEVQHCRGLEHCGRFGACLTGIDR